MKTDGIWMVLLLALVPVGYQLVAGKVVNPWRTVATRDKQPVLYWSGIALQVAFTVVLVYLLVRRAGVARLGAP